MASNTIDRLKAQLLKSGLQVKDQVLFQIINQLIDAVSQTIESTPGSSSGSGSGTLSQSFGTVNNEQATLANSKQLYPGQGIQFNNQGQKLIISGAYPLPDYESREDEAYIPLPGPQGATGLPGPISQVLGIPLPIIDNIEDNEIPVPLVNDPLNLDSSITGIWTPVLTSSGGGTPLYTSQSGSWVREKHKITGSFRIVLSSLGTLAAGNLSLLGLPVTANAINGIPFLCIFAGLGTNQIYIYNVVNPSTTELFLRKQTAAATSNATNLTLADITNGFIVAGGFTYFTF